MVAFVPRFVNQANRQWALEAEAAATAAAIDARDLARFEPFITTRERDQAPPRASVADVADHVDHVREVAGVDHVGLGADFDGVTTLPAGLEDVSTYPTLLQELADRGWSATDLAKLTCRNLLRTMRAVEDAAVPNGAPTGD
jgi:membrane dipeptidase